MRVNMVQNQVTFKKLELRSDVVFDIGESTIKNCQKKLSKTKHVDVIIDSHGLAIKNKMTDILQRIQSFSLFKEEQAIGINVDNGNEKTYKIKYDSYEEAKNSWKDLYETYYTKALEGYTKAALLLENFLDK